MEVHQFLDTFERWVLSGPAPTVDVTSFKDDMESLREDLDNILEDQVPESEAPSAEPAEDKVFVALFSTATVPLIPP